eukprot:scaffold110711_cov26-Phaeocystis_antarctica.AAC.1
MRTTTTTTTTTTATTTTAPTLRRRQVVAIRRSSTSQPSSVQAEPRLGLEERVAASLPLKSRLPGAVAPPARSARHPAPRPADP